MRLLLIVVLGALAVFALWWWRRDSEPAPDNRGRQPDAPALDDPQIILRAGPGACSMARQQAGRSFPEDEMPRLPLPGCRARSCNCRFQKIPGRRRGQRREQSDRRETIRFEESGDRRRGDRRKDSADPWGIDPDAD